MSSDAPFLGDLVTNTLPAQVPGPEPLTGKHVKLTRLTTAHFPDLWDNMGCPAHADLWTFWPDGPFPTAAEFHASMTSMLNFMAGDLAIYAVSLLAGPHADEAAGLAFALSEDRATNRVAELGLFFGPLLQRTTAATEVAYLVCGMMFALGHRRLQWKTNALNVASRRAAERYGLVHEGTMRQAQVCKGRNRDTAWFAMMDHEWGVCGRAFEVWLGDGNFDGEGKQRRKIEDVRRELMGASA